MEGNRSVFYEFDTYEDNVELVVQDVIEAVEQTAKGFYLNVNTPVDYGCPKNYLTEELDLHFGNKIDIEYIGKTCKDKYILRVWRSK